MAPGALVPDSPRYEDNIHTFKDDINLLSSFPDGLKTSGQHPPLYDALRPYHEFPSRIEGQTVWQKESYVNNPELWTHRFTPLQVAEISDAADEFIGKGIALEGISKSDFTLPTSSDLLRELRHELLNYKGFILLKGLPTDEWDPLKTAVAYMGLGTHLGYFVSQNGRGHVLGHVKDVGDNPEQTDAVRIYRTTARQFFHTDDGDVVGLLCVRQAAEGGESDIVSSHHIWNVLQDEHPDVAQLFTEPIWYVDRKGEVSFGEEEWIRQPVVYLENGGEERVYWKWDPYYVTSLTRFSQKGLIPALSEAQLRALAILEETCRRNALHMVLEPGDIQFLSNAHVLHARTAYTDFEPPGPRRHLLRLWLSTPDTEGGWVLPMPDSSEKKRGGIQVNDTEPRAPLDAE